MFNRSTQGYRFIGGLALLHTFYTITALLLTKHAMLLFSFGSTILTYRTLLISNYTQDALMRCLKWACWLMGILTGIHCVSILLEAFVPEFAFLSTWNSYWSTVRGADLVLFFFLFWVNGIEEKKLKRVHA